MLLDCCFSLSPHGRWWVVVQAAKVAVPIHQLDTHGKVLGQAHQGVVHRGVAMGMELAQHLAHNACTLPEVGGRGAGRRRDVRDARGWWPHHEP